MIDVVTVGAGGGSIAWISPEGTLKVGPQSARAPTRARSATARAAREPTITDAHVLLGPDPAAPARRRGAARRRPRPRRASTRWRPSWACRASACATGVLEISAWNQANALRQITVKRGLDVRDFTMVTFGGSGSLLACRLVDILGLDGVARAAQPGQPLGVRPADGRRTQRLRADRRRRGQSRSTRRACRQVYDALAGRADAALAREGFAAGGAGVRAAPRTCATSARPTRSGSTCRDGAVDRATCWRRWPTRSTTSTARSTATTSAHDARQEVEWVNLRVTGVGPIRKPALRRGRGRRGRRRRADRHAAGSSSTTGSTPTIYDRARLGAGDVVDGPGRPRGVLVDRAAAPRLHRAGSTRYGNLVIRRSPMTGRASRRAGRAVTTAGGATRSSSRSSRATSPRSSMEVETAIGRTSRSPMIRDAHDFRAGIHDRRLRKLTGRSYSALVHPVVRDYPIETMRPGDVFFHNDVYLSEGGIGHLPDLCVTAPVFHDAGDAGRRSSRSCRRSATTTTSAAPCPARCRRSATSVFEEGLMVPPIQLWDAGRAQRGGAEDHDPQLADARVAGRRPRRRVLGLPDGRAPDGRAVRPLRPRARSRPASTRSSTRRPRRSGARSCPRSPCGTYVWEDYAEHDGVDEPRLHTQRITLTKTPPTTRRRAAGPRLRTAPRRRPRGRSTTAATTPTATS